jgi:hypothetical protein
MEYYVAMWIKAISKGGNGTWRGGERERVVNSFIFCWAARL